jgi:hypothetical protein
LAVGVVLTVPTGFVVGYGPIWLQFFGSSPDAEDYQVSAGGYVAAAVVLLLGVVAALAHRGPRWVAVVGGGFGLVYLLLALGSWRSAVRASDPGPGIDTALDGAGGVLAMPWTWPVVVLAAAGCLRLARRSQSRSRSQHCEGSYREPEQSHRRGGQ